MSGNRHIGSSHDDLLRSEGLYDEVRQAAKREALAVLADGEDMPAEMAAALDRMRKALAKPVLVERDFWKVSA